MATNQYGIDTKLWALMSPEDQAQVIAEKQGTTSGVGGYSSTAVTPEKLATLSPAIQQAYAQNTAASPTAAPVSKPATAQNTTVIIRAGDEYGGYNELPPGTQTIVISSDDPNFANSVAKARQDGYRVGIMVASSSSEDPAVFGQRLAYYQNIYHPDVLVPDTEFMQGGQHVDAAWTQQAVDAYQAAATGPAPQLAVTFMPSQATDFDYSGWQAAGANVQFWPQTFGTDPSDPAQRSDPAAVAAAVQAQAPGATVVPLLVPGQEGYKGAGVYYAPPPNYLGGTGGSGPTVPGVNAPPRRPGQPPGPAEIPPYDTGGGGTTPTPPPPPPSLTDWAAVYFGNLGLPNTVTAQIETIFQQHADNPNLANGIAEQFLESTPWFAQNFPGYQEGVRNGLFTDKTGYRGYVNAVNVLSQRYQGRPVSGSEIFSYLQSGVDPSVVGNQYQGAAWAAANAPDVNYALGAAGGGQPTGSELSALGNEQAGLDTPLGQMVKVRLDKALRQINGMFAGSTQNPPLQLGAQGLNAPSLLGQRGVDQRGSADLSA